VAVRVVAGATPSRDRRRSERSSKHAKDIILAGIRSGLTVKRACEAAQRGESTFAYYKKTDANFRVMAEAALMARDEDSVVERPEVPDFPEFCERYLDTKMFTHHLQWYDLLEGREPRDLHPSQRYVRGDVDQLLCNTPPEHGKSTTLTVNYVTWRIVQDPNIRILLVSKTQDMAKRFLMAIKDRLSENERYADLQRTFGPVGGFAENAIWAAEKIRVNGADSGESAYTVQAVGIGGHIYGTRTDLAIMDDCVDHTNHQQYDSQINWAPASRTRVVACC
jgi:hypothetical protein